MWIVVYRHEHGDLYWNEDFRSWKMDRSAATKFETAEQAMLSYQEKSIIVSKHIYVEEDSIIGRLILNFALATIVVIVIYWLIVNGSKW